MALTRLDPDTALIVIDLQPWFSSTSPAEPLGGRNNRRVRQVLFRMDGPTSSRSWIGNLATSS